jgi:hypothetical protein
VPSAGGFMETIIMNHDIASTVSLKLVSWPAGEYIVISKMNKKLTGVRTGN